MFPLRVLAMPQAYFLHLFPFGGCSGKPMSEKARPVPARHTAAELERIANEILAEVEADTIGDE